jgi:hypothetical protein
LAGTGRDPAPRSPEAEDCSSSERLYTSYLVDDLRVDQDPFVVHLPPGGGVVRAD